MATLKQKTISGLTWSFIDNFASLGITFIVGIILARLLEPREFGLVGMTTIFIAISQSFIDSGFTQALIRKQDCTQADFSTVFYFNLAVGILFFLLLSFTAPLISSFFNEPQLTLIVQVLAIGLIINAFTIVQRARLTKAINFKLQTKISIIASILSGLISIWMAYNGYGVWSLVAKTLTGYTLTSMLLWLWNKWKPTLEFSKESFKEMFSFGSKLLLSGLLDTTYNNIYLLIIGKFFSATELGYYTRADQFKSLPSQNITGVIQRVSYPVLSSIQDDKQQLKAAYKKLIQSIMLITFCLMLAMAASAKPLILTLIGEKWLPAVIYLQLLCFVGMLYPLHALNLNMLNVLGRSDLFLKLEIIKKILAVPVIIIGIYYGIIALIISMFIISLVSYYLNSYWSGTLIGYPMKEQIYDILPAFLLAVLISTIIFVTGSLINLPNPWILLIQILTGTVLFIIISESVKLQDYLYIKSIVIEKLKR
ncbi:MAG TPA: lipopolysaccharide biosynthesis protein [Ignavibacteriaceae bacterium]|nr:MAG: lipopolysaccharide biosynthesis protein [Ignavibacteriales bacterium UTCHB2]HQF43236.1 lipopolysaccharide biosynthesis protein [Ignavibacteriaceae bacterium]HQI41289.1 lipopolysaccharide biosynthesis protein [Ignavibacteriaceae bacterium]